MERTEETKDQLNLTSNILLKECRPKTAYIPNNDGKFIKSMKKSQKPTCNFMSLSKLSNKLFSNELPNKDGKGALVVVSGDDSKIEYVLRGCNATLSQPLDHYDKRVYDSICTFYHSEHKLHPNERIFFTADQIYENMNGSDANPSKVAINEIKDSIEKMSCIRVSFDWTEHAKMSRISKKKLGEIKIGLIVSRDNLLHITSLETKINGKHVTGYELLKKPCIMEYEETVKQCMTYGHDLLVMKNISSTKENVTIKNYAIYRINLMKNEKNKICSNHISLETFYEECKISTNRVIRKRKRDVLLSILKEFKEKDFIKSFEKIKRNNVLISIEITL